MVSLPTIRHKLVHGRMDWDRQCQTERYPIEIHLEEDPDWLYFDDLAPIDP